MNELIKQLMGKTLDDKFSHTWTTMTYEDLEKFSEQFAELIVKECIDKIETYRIPVGNSAAGEMACEYTYDALKEIRNEIKEHFGVEEQEKVAPKPKCSVCGTTENVRYMGGYQPYLCDSVDCIPF